MLHLLLDSAHLLVESANVKIIRIPACQFKN